MDNDLGSAVGLPAPGASAWQFAVFGSEESGENALNRRLTTQGAHDDLKARLIAGGNLLYEVALTSNDGTEFGSLYIVQFLSLSGLDEWLAIEPYVISDVWRTVKIYPCRTVTPLAQVNLDREGATEAPRTIPLTNSAGDGHGATQFLVIGLEECDENALTRRAAVREAHNDVYDRLVQGGNLLFEAVLRSNDDPYIHTCNVVQFHSHSELTHWLAYEPYVTGEVWRNVEVSPCRVGSFFKPRRTIPDSFASVARSLETIAETTRTQQMTILAGCNEGAVWSKAAARWGYGDGTFEPSRLASIGSLIQPDDCVWDIGANYGYVSLFVSRLVGAENRVYACEPSQRNLWFLRQHLAWNNVANVEVVPHPIADADYQSNFGRNTNFRPWKDLCLRLGGGDEIVNARSVRSLIENDGLRPPTFMKIDAEGAEVKILTGAGRYLGNPKLAILLSYHGTNEHNNTYHACNDILVRLGFRVVLPDYLRGVDPGPWGGDADMLAIGRGREVSDDLIAQFKSIRPYA